MYVTVRKCTLGCSVLQCVQWVTWPSANEVKVVRIWTSLISLFKVSQWVCLDSLSNRVCALISPAELSLCPFEDVVGCRRRFLSAVNGLSSCLHSMSVQTLEITSRYPNLCTLPVCNLGQMAAQSLEPSIANWRHHHLNCGSLIARVSQCCSTSSIRMWRMWLDVMARGDLCNAEGINELLLLLSYIGA